MKKITFIGAGFAAMPAVDNLHQSDFDTEITLIAPKAERVSAQIQVGPKHV